jgi:site-specific recombinase XerD
MLRHTYASNALSAGVNIKELQEQLGHESVTETLDTYSHLMTENRRDFVSKLDAAHREKLKEHKLKHLRAVE